MWTTADYALIIGLCSALLSAVALGWNIWSKFIFPLPRLKVTANNAYFDESRKIVVTGQDGCEPPDLVGAISSGQVICIVVTNFGPVECIVEALVVKFSDRTFIGMIEPLSDWPVSAKQNGFFGSGLPIKLNVGMSRQEFILATKDLATDRNIVGLGIRDGYGRHHFCSKKNIRNLQHSIGHSPSSVPFDAKIS